MSKETFLPTRFFDNSVLQQHRRLPDGYRYYYTNTVTKYPPYANKVELSENDLSRVDLVIKDILDGRHILERHLPLLRTMIEASYACLKMDDIIIEPAMFTADAYFYSITYNNILTKQFFQDSISMFGFEHLITVIPILKPNVSSL